MTNDDRGQTVASHAEGGAVPPSSAPTVVENIGTCRCPFTPHPDGERVRFADAVSMALGAAAIAAINQADTSQEIMGFLAPIYLRFGIVEWSCRDADGPLDITAANAEARFPWADGGAELVDFADTLFAKDILAPLVKRRAAYLENGPTAKPTSPTSERGSSPQKPSRRSSPNDSEAGRPFAVPAP